MKTILLLKAGEVANPIRLCAGDYELWFRRTIAPERARLHRVDAYLDAPLPSPRRFDAVWMTGSPLSVTRPTQWMRRTGDYLLEASALGVPVLGICFGHQLIASALGAPIMRHPCGREIGSVQVELTPEGRRDPLFLGIPRRFMVQATHEDVVAHLPAGATRLAGNGHTALQAFAFGPRLRAVQFHPELSAEGMAAIIRARAPLLEEEAVGRGAPRGTQVRELLAGVQPAPWGKVLLQNFLGHFA